MMDNTQYVFVLTVLFAIYSRQNTGKLRAFFEIAAILNMLAFIALVILEFVQ